MNVPFGDFRCNAKVLAEPRTAERKVAGPATSKVDVDRPAMLIFVVSAWVSSSEHTSTPNNGSTLARIVTTAVSQV
jgi:hypothetical protein